MAWNQLTKWHESAHPIPLHKEDLHNFHNSHFPPSIPMAISSQASSLFTTFKTLPTTSTLHSLPPKPHHLTFKTPLSPLFFKTHISKSSLHPFQPLKTQSLFTGIVEELGEIKRLANTPDGGFQLRILASKVLEDVKLGDSIAVNGTCLTVTEFDHSEFSAGIAPETFRKTSLAELVAGSPVNLERAVQPASRMGGHFVQGHVDGTGEIVAMEREGDSLWVKVRTGEEVLRFVVPKGFIAVDGTSLTVVEVFDEEGCFNFMLVDYTQHNVVIPLKKVGQKVNLEVDVLGKYVERLLKSGFADVVAQV